MAVKLKLFSIIIEIFFSFLRYDKVLLPTRAETRDGSRGLNLATTGVIAQVSWTLFRLNLDLEAVSVSVSGSVTVTGRSGSIHNHGCQPTLQLYDYQY
jgi:hypothetical protein